MAKDSLIVEEMKKRFQQICEYVTVHDDLSEDDNQPDAQGGPDPMGGGGPDPMGGGDAQGGPDPMGGGGPDPMGGGDAQGGPDPMGGGDAQGGPAPMGGGGPEGFDPQGDHDPTGGADPTGGGDGMDMDQMLPPEGEDGAGDDEIDITEFTDSQKNTENSVEKAEEDIDKMDKKFGKVMKMLGAFEELLRQNDKKIEDLTSEFEKRNPTQIEKLSMQTANSYPFNVTPEQYWKEKEATSNYRTEDDDNGKEQGQYVITKDDVDGNVDWKSIADSLDDKDFMYNQTLKGAMGI